ncbi:MAG: hypothetical protein EP329_23925 [Deltaproteobacteria bacterium]|nr:MAG: hypothetical protein EP329_23925 [Deltaproteobacteria bacterium]
MDDEARAAIATLVRTGFYRHDRLVEIFATERYRPGRLDPAEIDLAIRAEAAALAAEEAGWPEVTDCDRLDRAFAALRREGVFAKQNAGYTQHDGYDDFLLAVRRSPRPEAILGYCFCHGQDLERAIAGEGLRLGFGPKDPATEQTRGVEVGRRVVAALAREGLASRWNGTFAERILLPGFRWQKRNRLL